MKLKLITLALVAFLGMNGISAMAQNTDNQKKCSKEKTECKAKKDKKMRGGMDETVFFEGITLTPEQQTKLDANNVKRQEARKAAMADSTKQRPDRKQMMRNYITEVKEVLSPEQYVVFLENVAVNQGNKAQAMGKKMEMKARKDLKKGKNVGHQEMKKADGKFDKAVKNGKEKVKDISKASKKEMKKAAKATKNTVEKGVEKVKNI
ncbi:MAG: hypothetical protein K2M79_00450 [Muribaculaceae bacterium]|nr:hypothetical protein [Muribaculaceae bacterium]